LVFFLEHFDNQINRTMLKNYLIISWRNLVKNKAFTVINIAGLAIGIATCLIILLFVREELSFDRFNEKANQLVRVVFRGKMAGENMKESSVMAPVAQTLKTDFPEVIDATRLTQNGFPKVIADNRVFTGDSFAYVDSNFFQVFTLPLVKGDPKTVLANPNTLVISQSLAEKYFGKSDPVGRILNFKEENQSFRISGIMRDIPENSHFHFAMLGAMSSFPDSKNNSWISGTYFTYLVLRKGYDYKKLEAKLPQTVEKYIGPQLLKGLGLSLAEFRRKGNDVGLYLQPITDIHLRSDFSNSLEPGGDIRYVYIFGAIAVFMLLIACINFMNLSTASSARRAKEVGIRKALGSVKKELIGQFLIESAILTFFALLAALVLVIISLPAFNQLSGKNLRADFLEDPSVVFGLFLCWLIVSLLAGSYPAFYLSAFNPVSVLKGKIAQRAGNISLRSALVVFQFFISVTLIVGTSVVYMQLSFIQNIKLGYNRDQILVLRNSYLLGKNEDAFREELAKDPRVLSITISSFLPAGPTNTNMTSTFPDDQVNLTSRARVYQIDDNYIPTLGMKIVQGRNFSKAFPSDSSKENPAVIINQTMANVFGWGKNAVGHTVNLFTDNTGGKMGLKVVGVVEDFHFRSLHEPINPLLMVLQKNSGLILKISPVNITGLLAKMKNQWDAYKTDEPFSYSFLDELYNQSYLSERKTGIILGIFAGLTIFIGCLGLFGLATFTAERRNKEIGIRKVLGASLPSLFGLLSREFILLVGIAILIATPLSWWAMNLWLRDFAYRIQINGWLFVFAGLTALFIALVTVSYQAIRSAIANPVISLRSE